MQVRNYLFIAIFYFTIHVTCHKIAEMESYIDSILTQWNELNYHDQKIRRKPKYDIREH